jgi:hypothetical protein
MAALKSKPTGSFFERVTVFLKALYIFFPGIIFLLLGLFIFLNLPQGKDIIYQSTDGRNSWLTGLYLVLATIFWVFTTWYTARLIAYNHDDLFAKTPWVLYHFPRLLGYFIFLVLWLAIFLIDDVEHKLNGWAWAAAGIDLIIYIFFAENLERSFEKINEPRRRLLIIRNVVRGLILLSCVVVIIGWQRKAVDVLLYTIPIFQLGFLFLVILRHPLYKSVSKENPGTERQVAISKYLKWTFSGDSKGTSSKSKLDPLFERPVFIIYHIIAFFALLCYLLSINYLPFAREVSSFPLALLAFGILLGIINFLGLLSRKKNVNFNFLLLSLIIIAGFFFEIHPVRMKSVKDKTKLYAARPSFRKYLESWIQWHKKEIDSSGDHYPVIFTLADGGASRSGYWAALVLGTLHEATRYDTSQSNKSFFTDHLFCLSGASGGSVGNASFLSALKIQQQHPELKTDILSTKYLDNDFLAYPLARLFGPDLIKPLFGWIRSWGDRAAALEVGMDYPLGRDSLMGKVVRNDFGALVPNDQNQFPMICINTTKVNDGGPGVVSTIDIDKSNVRIEQEENSNKTTKVYTDAKKIFGKRVDALNYVPPGYMIRVSTAMVLGARFPYMSPGGKLGNDYFVDGGYFDNSGAGVVHEMLLELNRIAKDTTDALHPVVKKFHYYVLHLSNTPYVKADSTHKIHPTLNDLATPLLTLAGSYNSQTSVNDARLTNYLEEINKERRSYMILNLYRTDTIQSIPMNWVISDTARSKMTKRIKEKTELFEIAERLRKKQNDSLFNGIVQKN